MTPCWVFILSLCRHTFVHAIFYLDLRMCNSMQFDGDDEQPMVSVSIIVFSCTCTICSLTYCHTNTAPSHTPGHHITCHLLIDNCQHTICVRYYCNTHHKRGGGVDNTIARNEVGCINGHAKVSIAAVKVFCILIAFAPQLAALGRPPTCNMPPVAC